MMFFQPVVVCVPLSVNHVYVIACTENSKNQWLRKAGSGVRWHPKIWRCRGQKLHMALMKINV